MQGLSKNGYYYLTFETAIFCRRFDKQFSQVYQLTKNGNFGQLRTVKMESRDNQINLEYFAHNKGLLITWILHFFMWKRLS